MDSTVGEGIHYVVAVGSDGNKMVQQPLQGVTVKNDNLYQYFVNSSTGSGQHVPIVTIGPNGKLIPVRDRSQNSNHSEIGATEDQGIMDDKSPVKTDTGDIGEEHEEEEPHESQLHQQVLRPDRSVKGEKEVECAKSCRACCNIDEPTDASFTDPKDDVQADTLAAKIWSSGRSGSTSSSEAGVAEAGVEEAGVAETGVAEAGVEEAGAAETGVAETGVAEASSSGGASDEKLPNNFPLVLGLVPAANQSPDPLRRGRFQCKVCFKLFTQKVNLTTHERIHLGERPYQCKVCLKAFTQQSNLVTHERIHTGERPYQCQVCFKRFTQRQNLTAHERIHLGERPFQCQVCQKAFTQRQNLVAHERIHLGERPYQCQVCLKSFTQQQNLTAHERIHSGDRHFVCPVCQKSFTQEQNLSKHMLTHTGEKPYPCQYCNKSFTQKSNLTSHQRSHLVAHPATIEGPDGKRKVYIYSHERILSAPPRVQFDGDSEDGQDSGTVHTEPSSLSSLYPATRQQ